MIKTANPLKVAIEYNDGQLKLMVTNKTIKVLKRFCVFDDTTYFYAFDRDIKRYLIKRNIFNKVDRLSYLFFSVDLLKNGYVCFNVRSIHDLDLIKKRLNRDLNFIFDCYLKNNVGGEYGF